MSESRFCYGYTCIECKETNFSKDEVVFLNGNNIIEDEEHGGSGDIDRILCNECYDKLYSQS